jgi:ABC-type transport system involved in multi-copper enzyme maturation permease subunit
MRLVLDCLGRLARRPATWVTYGLVVGLMVFVFVVIGATANSLPDSAGGGRAALSLLTFPGAYDSVLAFLIGIGTLLAVIYGGAVAGSEWTWGTLKNAVARGESRAGYVTALFVAVAVVLAVGLVVAMAIGVIAAVVGATMAGLSTSGLGDATYLGALPEKLARGWLGIAEAAAIGFAIATLARSQLAGIGVGIATYFAEQFSTIFFPDVVKFLPFHAAEAAVNLSQSGGVNVGNGGAQVAARLAPDVALVVVLCWLAGALVVGAVVTRRADITG